MKRSFVLLALAIALPAILLAAGWSVASRNERASKRDAESLRASRALAAAREAVAGGLEALRAREDERPFYLYNHYYSPPEVLAVSDPVAVSPLASAPNDARVIGWFQIEPDGTVRTPGRVAAIATGSAGGVELETLTETGTETETEIGTETETETESETVTESMADASVARLVRIARAEAFDDLRAVVAASEGALVVRATRAEPVVAPSVASAPARTRVASRRPARGEVSVSTPSATSDPSSSATAVPQQVTVSLNTIDNQLADEIRRAQAGDVVALERVTQRGRAAPITRRENTDLATIRTQQAAFQSNVTPSASNAQPSAMRSAVETAAPSSTSAATPRATNATNAINAINATSPQRARASSPSARPPDTSTTGTEPRVSLTPIQIDVQYTPMTWRDRGEVLALARVVSHEGAAIAQVVALDRARIEAWVDDTIARSTAGSDVTVHRAAADERCLHEARTEAFPSALRLCVSPAAFEALSARLDTESRIELLALVILLALVVLAVVASLRAIRREQELARTRSEFVTAVSHELRTPLTTLRMHAEMLADDLVPESRRDKVHHELVRETQRLSRLVENVLETSRLEAGRRVVTRAPADLVARARTVIESFSDLAASRDAKITLHAPDDAHCDVDSDAFERILVNLVDNALKYGLSDGSPREIEVSIAVGDGPAPTTSEPTSDTSSTRTKSRASRTVELRVSDRGPGVAPADRERVFRRFVRATRADAAHRPGTGLGLALVRELARAHGGDARLEAREGGGTAVIVVLA